MANVVMSNNLKRVKQFIKADGTIAEGTIEENMGHGLGGARLPNPVSTRPQEPKKE
jgi:hypothetical protein